MQPQHVAKALFQLLGPLDAGRHGDGDAALHQPTAVAQRVGAERRARLEHRLFAAVEQGTDTEEIGAVLGGETRRQVEPAFAGLGRVEANQHVAEGHGKLPTGLRITLNAAGRLAFRLRRAGASRLSGVGDQATPFFLNQSSISCHASFAAAAL